MFERRSALQSALIDAGRDGEEGSRRLRIGELTGWTLFELSSFAETEATLAVALKPLLGDLPARVGIAVRGHHGLLLKVANGQYLLIGRAAENPGPALQAAVRPELGSVISLTNGRTCIVVEGAHARQALASELSVDLDPGVLQEQGFVLTGLHHTPVLVHRASAHRYELYVLRTYALSIWEVLIDAALPYGYDVRVERIDESEAAYNNLIDP
jgi:methylglutamate dehydrogenase subunit D